MQTRRRASKAAATMVGAVTTSPKATAAIAITPSPQRKKFKHTHHGNNIGSSSRAMSRLSGCSNETDNIREEMKSLLMSHINIEGEDPSGGNLDTTTIGGWCLIDGLVHCGMASNGILLPLIKEHGPPAFYLDHLKNKNTNDSSGDSQTATKSDGYQSFRSLCRIVAGQQLAGNTAKTIWRRLLGVVDATEDDTTNLTPETILGIVENGDVDSDLRAPAGLSNAKCNCCIAIATAFQDGTLSDDILLGAKADDEKVRSLLLSIKGLGPWSVDMLMLFQIHKSDVLPIGDLAFRNGTRKLWKLKGNGKGGALCPKKDVHLMNECHDDFAPYRSISSYYMYKCSGMKG